MQEFNHFLIVTSLKVDIQPGDRKEKQMFKIHTNQMQYLHFFEQAGLVLKEIIW